MDSPCGDWEPYKEEKCFKIFDKEGLQTYTDAEKTCHQQESSSSLISIRSFEEQEFISNLLFKTHKVVDNIWIGAKYTNKFKWTDDSDLVFTYWAEGSPKNKTDRCIQLNSDENSVGKWSDVFCNKKKSGRMSEDANLVTISVAKSPFEYNKKSISDWLHLCSAAEREVSNRDMAMDDMERCEFRICWCLLQSRWRRFGNIWSNTRRKFSKTYTCKNIKSPSILYK